MCISVNNDFAALQYGQENRLVFSLCYLAPRSLALEVFKSPVQGTSSTTTTTHLSFESLEFGYDCGIDN